MYDEFCLMTLVKLFYHQFDFCEKYFSLRHWHCSLQKSKLVCVFNIHLRQSAYLIKRFMNDETNHWSSMIQFICSWRDSDVVVDKRLQILFQNRKNDLQIYLADLCKD